MVGKNCGQKKHIVGGGKIGQKKKFDRKKDVGQNFFLVGNKILVEKFVRSEFFLMNEFILGKSLFCFVN